MSSLIGRRAFLGAAAAFGLSPLLGNARGTSVGASVGEGSVVQWVRLRNGYKVWTQRIGSGPKKILLLHGGPGFSHDYLEIFARHLPAAGYEMYFYDQLGCGFSDRPDDPSLWTLSRYVDEVAEVRAALKLENCVLLGHSWGGILAIDYVLRQKPRLAGFVLSNTPASFADYARYTRLLRSQLPQHVQDSMAELERTGKGSSPEFDALVQKELYPRHICRLKPWPAPINRTLAKVNATIYNQMQGANEFAMTGTLSTWTRWSDLASIEVPTLVMGARHDEIDPASVRTEATLIPGAQLFISDTGSHLAMWDDEANYFAAIQRFLDGVWPRR